MLQSDIRRQNVDGSGEAEFSGCTVAADHTVDDGILTISRQTPDNVIVIAAARQYVVTQSPVDRSSFVLPVWCRYSSSRKAVARCKAEHQAQLMSCSN